MNIFDFFKKCTGFEWDEHDSEDDRQRYRVTPSECEEFFFNHPLVVADDVTHPGKKYKECSNCGSQSKLLACVYF